MDEMGRSRRVATRHGSTRRRPGRSVRRYQLLGTVIGVTAIAAGAVATTFTAAPASADPVPADVLAALDLSSGFIGSAMPANPAGLSVETTPLDGFPTNGSSYLVLSTGNASDLIAESADVHPSTDLGTTGSADGHDLTRVRLDVIPPTGATCLAFDFAFLSEEYPEYVNSQYNDVFTAELNQTAFSMQDHQVVAPNNFAYDSQGNPVSINTVFGMGPIPGTSMDGATPPLAAVTPIELGDDSTMSVYLSVQDLGDSIFDSVALIDNMRWLYGANCTPGTAPLTDTDHDGLSDDWELHGIDYDHDGTPELDLPAMGADPNVRDLFIEVDWMEKDPHCILFFCWGGKSFAPMQSALDDVVAAFAAAPGSPIRVHIDAGPGSVMNPVTHATWGARSRSNALPYSPVIGAVDGSNYVWSDFEALRDANFSTLRADAFHYVVYADKYQGWASTDCPSGQCSSGISRGIPGGELIVTDGPWGDGGFSRTQERGTFMHELGHNLNLYHGGGPTGAYQGNPVYQSIMNYAYQLIGTPPGAGLDYSRGTPYDDWANLRFDGGSVGDLGDSAPAPAQTLDDSLTYPKAVALDVLDVPGGGTVRFVGPTLLLKDSGTRQLLFDVHNDSKVADTYAIALSTDLPVPATVSVTVPAGETTRVPVDVGTGALTVGSHHLTASLSSTKAGSSLSTTSGDIVVPDPADPDLPSDLQEIRDGIAGGNVTDLDPQVRDAVVDQIDDIGTPPPPPPPPPPPGHVTDSTRFGGEDRIATAIKASQGSFGTAGAATVVLARSDIYPDALAGTPLAASLRGPLLLTPSTSLDDRTLSEIARVLPAGGTVHLLGGDEALGGAVDAALRNAGFQTVRHAGVDRYATATAIAAALGDPQDLLVVTGVNFPDALTAGAAAAHAHGAVLLTSGAAVPASTAQYLSAHPTARVTAIGGPAATALPQATIVAGLDRYATAVMVAERFFSGTETYVGIASGENFPDGLAGGASIAMRNGPLLLVRPTSVPDGVLTYVRAHRPDHLLLYGGTEAISTGVQVVLTS